MPKNPERAATAGNFALVAAGAPSLDIGISAKDRKALSEALGRVLADSYTLYLKTHNYHWNVTGPLFQSLHVMFQDQYTALALAVDEIAERIRALGHVAPGSYAEFGKLSSVQDAVGTPTAEEMVRDLVIGNETAARTARAAFKVAERANDQPTADLMTERLTAHEKTAWMLRATLG